MADPTKLAPEPEVVTPTEPVVDATPETTEDTSTSEDTLEELSTLLEAESGDAAIATEPENNAGIQSPETETPEPDKPEVEDDHDAELDDLPESDPKPDDWKKVREINKDRKRQIRELEEKLEASKQATPAPSVDVPVDPKLYATDPKPEPEPSAKYDPVWLVSSLARANEGDEQYTAYKPQILDELQKLDPRELADVGKRAQLGAFGEGSEDMAAVVAQVLPIAQAEHESRRRDTEQRQVAQSQRAESWKVVTGEMPQIGVETSEHRKAFAEANAVLLKSIPTLWDVPDAPSVVMEYVRLKGSADASAALKAELAKAKAENAALKKRVGEGQSPQGGGSPRTALSETNDIEQELEQGFTELGLVHR